MTEEQKLALIGLCKIEIRRWEAAAEAVSDKKYMVELMKIALAALTAQPVKLPDNMPCKGAPQYIWLQVGCDTGNASEWPEHSDAGVTWHTEQIHSDDVLYVRANNDEVQE